MYAVWSPAVSNTAWRRAKLRVEKLEAEVGSEIKFDNILMLGDATA
jgi:ribosomal protein L21